MNTAQFEFDFDAPAKTSAPAATTPEPATREDRVNERLLAYVTSGQPVVLRLEMKVQEVNQLWDDLWTRGNDAAAKLKAFGDQCAARRTKETPKHEKRRLADLAEWHWELAGLAEALPEMLFSDAQTKLSEELAGKLPEGDHDGFWSAVSGRPGIEWSWHYTLAEVLAEITEPQAELCAA